MSLGIEGCGSLCDCDDAECDCKKECTESGECPKHHAESCAAFVAEFGLPNSNARYLVGSKDEEERMAAECREAGR